MVAIVIQSCWPAAIAVSDRWQRSMVLQPSAPSPKWLIELAITTWMQMTNPLCCLQSPPTVARSISKTGLSFAQSFAISAIKPWLMVIIVINEMNWIEMKWNWKMAKRRLKKGSDCLPAPSSDWSVHWSVSSRHCCSDQSHYHLRPPYQVAGGHHLSSAHWPSGWWHDEIDKGQ